MLRPYGSSSVLRASMFGNLRFRRWLTFVNSLTRN